MPTYLEIAVNVPSVADVFHYHLPVELEGKVHAGHLVEVPFGKRRVQGVVLQIIDKPAVSDTKAVSALVDNQVVLTPAQITLAGELASITLAPLAACIGLMLPPGLGQQADTLYRISRKRPSISEKPLTDLQKRLLTMLDERGPLRGRQIDQAIPRANWRNSARSLVRRGLISTQSVLPSPTVKSKSVRTVQLNCSLETAETEMPKLGRVRTKALKRRQDIMRYLMRETGPVDVAWVYAESGGNLNDLRMLAKRGLVTLGENEVMRDPLDGMDFQITKPPPLTADQMICWRKIEAGINTQGDGQLSTPYLLHGVTGSGKTEIYLQAVEATMRTGKQAIVLVPEIALTPQTVRRFVSRFPGKVGLVHSRLSVGERYDTWRRARAGELSVVVGPRSALFTPFEKLGLIVLDECHDTSYYQSEPPFYHARQVVVLYARLTGAICLLGSATPDVTSTYRAAQGKWQYIPLPRRILAHRQAVQAQVDKLGLTSRYRPLEAEAETMELPPVRVVDMRDELKSGNSSIFSRDLQSTLGQVLQKNQQAILFLNRRGTATYVFCRDCGHTLKCPHCNLPLTYHGSLEALTCHHCGYKRKMPKTCPNCKSARIRHYGTGTERVESEVKALYPETRTLRWDYETTRKKGAHEVILSLFSAHQADVLVGTQMLAKGLDLPMVTLVGVVLADVGLNLPDYSAGERTFQVLTQVAGRAGRSPLGGEVILQTFQPEHYVIQTAAGHNYRDFYHQELKYRQELGYPPATRLVRLEFRHTDADRAERAAHKLALQVERWIKEGGYRSTEMVGPVPCFYAQLGGLYRWQIVLRGPNPISLLRGHTIRDWRIEVNPPSLL